MGAIYYVNGKEIGRSTISDVSATAASSRARNSHGPSFLRWAGSKRKSLVELSSLYSSSLRYVEPFAGSASLFFHLKPSVATLADLNGHLINAMNVVKSSPEDLYSELLKLNRHRDAFYKVREEFNQLDTAGLRAAVYFVYLNRNCFNGLWRTNSSGRFNVPYGGLKMTAYPPLELLKSCSKLLQNADLHQRDFRETLDQVGQGCFVYADPPYFTAGERTFIEYGQKSFGREDLTDLLQCLLDAHARGAKVVLSYNSKMPLTGIPDNWSRRAISVTRNVGGFSGSRKQASEDLYVSP